MTETLKRLAPYLSPNAVVEEENGIPSCPLLNPSPGLLANAYYFGHPTWSQNWIAVVHQYPEFRARWLAVAGTWDDQIVVDVGCGPGNLHAALKGSPKLLIGVDVSLGALVLAEQRGYLPLRADAHQLPLISEFADYVALNATLHHCDDMSRVLIEAARLVRPGGVLVADHDPQCSAYAFRGLGLWLWKARLPIYRWLKRGGHTPKDDEQTWALATELHHHPSDGVTPELFLETLRPLGFDVTLYPHNHRVGAEVQAGVRGCAPFKVRLAQRLSRINPHSPEGCMALMCVAKRKSQ
jgi:ubiquinone/menaquinone biosynthesis C-methylase UbiE